MKRLWKALAIFVLMLVAVPAQAALQPVNIGLQDVIDTVEKSYLSLNSVAADFFQRSTLAKEQRELRADGQFYLKLSTPFGASSPQVMFRFDYFRPTTQEVVSNGRTLWTYLPENRQVIQSDLTSVMNPYAFDPSQDRGANFLQGLGRISKDFMVIFSPQRQDIAGNYVLELTPRRSTAGMAKLFIVVNRDAVTNYVQHNRNITSALQGQSLQEWLFPVLSTTMVDHQGNTTSIEFSNVKANMMLSEDLFTFTAPPGVQVLRPTTGP